MAATRRDVITVLALIGAGLAWAPVGRASARRVLATTSMIGDATRVIAGPSAEVEALMGEGVDPHLYRATRSDVARMLQADIVFYNGLLLEGKMTDALVRVARAGKPVFAVTELIDEGNLVASPAFAGHFDPHVWMDPRAWARAVDVVRDLMVQLDPAAKDGLCARADTYQARLEELDAYAEDVLASVPAERRVLVTAHDAFAYFGRRYGFEVLGIQGLSTESEAGLQRIEELVRTLVDRRIPAVFVESTIPEQSVQALVAGAAARGHKVVVGGSLFSDAMGRPGSYEGTYVGMIDHNVTVIARALGGNPPVRGFSGRLASAARQ